jgi:hypothetical protein
MNHCYVLSHSTLTFSDVDMVLSLHFRFLSVRFQLPSDVQVINWYSCTECILLLVLSMSIINLRVKRIHLDVLSLQSQFVNSHIGFECEFFVCCKCDRYCYWRRLVAIFERYVMHDDVSNWRKFGKHCYPIHSSPSLVLSNWSPLFQCLNTSLIVLCLLHWFVIRLLCYSLRW